MARIYRHLGFLCLTIALKTKGLGKIKEMGYTGKVQIIVNPLPARKIKPTVASRGTSRLLGRLSKRGKPVRPPRGKETIETSMALLETDISNVKSMRGGINVPNIVGLDYPPMGCWSGSRYQWWALSCCCG